MPVLRGVAIVPVKIQPDVEWCIGNYSIAEPVEGKRWDRAIDLGLIPGLAFGKKGERLGRGKGCFDLFLASHRIQKKIGVCFSFQVLENVPVGPSDMRMDIVVSGKEIYYARENGE